ncbi:MAG: hypothetical protein AAF384_01290 [Pseudomonadota bacterium]
MGLCPRVLAGYLTLWFASGALAEWDISGFVSAEGRFFTQSPRFSTQPETATGSLSFKPEFYREWGDDLFQSFLFVPFGRIDKDDAERTHFDIRELTWLLAADAAELRLGFRKVFWGVAESNHLVDVINQTDLVENIDVEDRLGQPMVNLALISDFGTLDLFVLTGFRERTFPGREGRLQGPLRIDLGRASFESAAGNKHVDYAARYSHFIGDFDIGLSHFWGTSREPRFLFQQLPSGERVLVPRYDLIHQTSVDLQATKGDWLWKFEGLRREGQGDTYLAAVGGFEYTFVGAFDTAMDVGVLSEYHIDDRWRDALSPFNNDLFVGSRLAVNDAADTQFLGGLFSDLYGNGYFLNLEASRRFGDYWKLELEARFFLDIKPADPLAPIARDDYVLIELFRYF